MARSTPLLPLLQLVSIVYDAVWLFLLQDMAKEGAQEGGLEASIKNFSVTISWVNFVFKVSN